MTDENTTETPQNDPAPVAAPPPDAPTAPEPQNAPDPTRTKAQAAYWANRPPEDFERFVEAYEQMGGTRFKEMQERVNKLELDTARKDALLEHSLDKKYGKYLNGDSPDAIYQQAQELAADLAEIAGSAKDTGGDKPKPTTEPSTNPPVAEKGAGAGGVSPPPPPPPTSSGLDPIQAAKAALIDAAKNKG